jgi:NADPH:quinone reductase-like Zn-dependent oxidoreductase
MKQLIEMLWTRIAGDRKVLCVLSPQRTEDLISVKELIEAGEIKSIIDTRYPLEQTAEAHRHVEEGRKKGQIVITVEQERTNG